MAIVKHNDLPFQKGYRSKIFTRTLINSDSAAQDCQLWEQRIPTDGYIIAHSHPTEEIITLLTGQADVTIGEENSVVHAPATLFIPANTIHSMKNHGKEEISLLAFLPTDKPEVIYPTPPQPVDWG